MSDTPTFRGVSLERLREITDAQGSRVELTERLLLMPIAHDPSVTEAELIAWCQFRGAAIMHSAVVSAGDDFAALLEQLPGLAPELQL